jgi:hypothetical protein
MRVEVLIALVLNIAVVLGGMVCSPLGIYPCSEWICYLQL